MTLLDLLCFARDDAWGALWGRRDLVGTALTVAALIAAVVLIVIGLVRIFGA